MTGKDIIMMNQKERKRIHIIRNVIDKRMEQKEAAEMLLLSCRQIRRIVKRIKEEGDKGIIHKSRGKGSNRRISQEVREKVIKLYRVKYADFGPTLASEKLFEIDRIEINDETLRKWLIETGDWKKVRKGRNHREWRERKHYFGEMEQMDGSHHDWFEGRGAKCVLMCYIDDAVNNVFAKFYEYEGSIPAMDSFKGYIREYGIPMSIYVDKHTTYKSTGKATIEDELSNTRPLSQFERAVEELGIEIIHANTPQAKGRVERVFRVFQDRLIKEMRLKGIKSIEEANKFLEYYLPIFNKRFRVKPIEEGNLHRPMPENIDLDVILCIREQRTLRNDFTIVYNKKLYQIVEHITAKKVIVEERVNGRMLITYKGKSLRYKEIVQRPIKEEVKGPILKMKKVYIPPMNHPWRMYKINNYHQIEKELVLTGI